MPNSIVNTAQAAVWERLGLAFIKEQAGLERQNEIHGLRGIDASNLAGGEVVLDVGCGTGATSFELAKRVGQSGSVVGADIAGSMVDAANENAAAIGASNVSFILADAQVHTFDRPFDLIFSRFGTMFFGEPEAAFANLHSALKPTGRITLLCWQGPEKNGWAGPPRRAVQQFLPKVSPPNPDAPGPFSMADPDKIRRLIEGAGFSSVSIDGFEAKVSFGRTLEEATDFLFAIYPATASLEATDPAVARKAWSAMRDVLAPFLGAGGVEIGSATWVVTGLA